MNATELLSFNGNKEDSFTVDGNEVMEIKLIRKPDDINSDDGIFKPDMCHQVFGESEQIFGYKGLKIKLYYAAGNLTTYVGMEYDEKLNGVGIEPDNVMDTLCNVIQSDFETNISIFEKQLELDDTFHPYGDHINSFTIKESNDVRNFEIFVSDTNDQKFLGYHQKLQTFVLFYIDAANYINPDEGNWKFFVIYEKYLSNNMSVKYAVNGYASVYEYYAYPAHIRPRISQVVVLPPFRCMGICAKLLSSIYDYYRSNRKVLDITVESPSQEFQRVRDYVDCLNCMELNVFSSQNIKNGVSEEMLVQAREKFKINKKQAIRIYEILRLNFTNLHNDKEYDRYIAEVKERFLRPHKKRIAKRKFWSYFGSDPEECFVPAMQEETEIDKIDDNFNDHFENLKGQYEQVITRINDEKFKKSI